MTEASKPTTKEDMDVVVPATSDDAAKRPADGSYGGAGEPKKQRVDEVSAEEERAEKSGPVELGPKRFGSSVEMFDYFFKLIHHWPPYLNLNKGVRQVV